MWSRLLLLAQLCNTRRELLIETPDEQLGGRAAGCRMSGRVQLQIAARPGGELLVEAHHAETGGRPNRMVRARLFVFLSLYLASQGLHALRLVC